MATQYATEHRSLGQVFKELTADVSTLFRSEIALLKLEIKDTVANLSGGIGLFAGAAIVGLFGIAFLFVTITLALIALGLYPWAAALIITILLFAVAGLLAFLGKKKFEEVNFVPNESVAQIKSDIETLKADITKARNRP